MSSRFVLKKVSKKPKLNNSILIEGLPGIGNVARIATEYLIDKLKAKKYLEVYSSVFPNSVFINEDSTIEMPKLEVYCWKSKKKSQKDLVLVIGDVQPVDEEKSYLMCEEIINIGKELGAREIITLGGIGLSKVKGTPKVYGAVNNKKVTKKFQKYGVKFNGNKTVGLIVGAAGLLLGIGSLKGMDGVALLGETIAKPDYLGIKASRSILKVLQDYLDIKLTLKDLDKEIKEFEKGRDMREETDKKLMKMIMSSKKEDMYYIG